MGVSLSSVTSVYCDNMSAIQIAHNDVFMNGPNILRLIVIWSKIIFFRAHYSFILSRLLISSWIFLQSYILQGVFMIVCPNSSWSLALYLELEGAVRVYVVLSPHWLCIYSVCIISQYIDPFYILFFSDSIYNLILNNLHTLF
jgi:hypothetical protein